MDLDTLIKRLDIGETSDFECKAAENEFPKEAWKTISAFANTNGGYLVLGITEKKGKFYPSGIKNAAYQQQNFWNAHNDKTKINIPLIDESNVNEIKINDLSIIVIKVPRASRTQRPVYINNNPNTGTFKRQGEGDYLCTELEVRQMLRDANDRPQDSLILENFGLNDIDRDALKAFRNRFSSRDPDHPFLALDDLGLLEKLGAWKQDLPFKLDENAIRTGETSVHKAIREAVANTLIHADHSATQAITIIKHKDSFLFSNPGCLRISVEQLFAGGQSDPRNPNIQTMFRMIGLGERAGSGFPRIIQACQEQQWIGPVVSGALDLNRTTVILLMVSLIPEEVDRDLRQIAGNEYCSLSELDRMILFLAHRLTDISNNNIQQYSQKHPRDIGDCLKRLVQKGYLEQSGSGRGTHYSLAKIQPNSDRLDVNPDHLNVNPDHLDANPDHLDVKPDRLEKLKALAAPVRNKGNVPEGVTRQTILDPTFRTSIFTTKSNKRNYIFNGYIIVNSRKMNTKIL